MVDQVAAGKFLTQELRQYDPEFYSVERYEKWGAKGLYHPSTADLTLGVREVVQSHLETTGKAGRWDGKATNIPIANFGVGATSYKASVYVIGAEWTTFDLQASAVAKGNALLPQRDLVRTNMEALQIGMDEAIHDVVAFGDPDIGMDGLFSGGSIEVLTPATNPYTLSPQDLYEFFLELIWTFKRQSKVPTDQISVYLPTPLLAKLLIPIENQGGATPLSHLLGGTTSQYGKFAKVFKDFDELESSFLEQYRIHSVGTNKDRIAIGQFDSTRALRRQFYPIDRTEPRLADDGITYRVTAFYATTESQYRMPYRFQFVDVPKAA